jgi:hypothetical protein
MFFLAFTLGLTGYAILALGLLKLLTQTNVLIIAVVSAAVIIFRLISTSTLPKLPQKTSLRLLLGLFAIVILTHLLGLWSPEFYFDSLWYHLTLPKIYLEHQQYFFIPGKLYYYSGMPQLTEFLYLIPIAINPSNLGFASIGARLIHFSFALLSSYTIIKITKLKLKSSLVSILAAIIFLTDLSIFWLTSTAYIDLARTFFEVSSIYYLLLWEKSQKNHDLLKSGLLMGFAISTKYFSLATLFASAVFVLLRHPGPAVGRIRDLRKPLLALILPAFATSLFWFANAYYHTGNPIYPIFTANLDSSHQFSISLQDLSAIFTLSLSPKDWLTPISPLYIILLPLIFLNKTYFNKLKSIIYFALAGFVVWLIIPKTGGARFLSSVLPFWGILGASTIQSTKKVHKNLPKIILTIILVVVVANLTFRLYVNKRNLPYILGKQSQAKFLTQNLNLGHAFWDFDNEIKDIVGDETVLIIGGHSLYYVPFNYEHENYAPNQEYRYILVQYAQLPEKYSNYVLVYENPQTQVKLYRSLGPDP